jgi:hypothetical protein
MTSLAKMMTPKQLRDSQSRLSTWQRRMRPLRSATLPSMQSKPATTSKEMSQIDANSVAFLKLSRAGVSTSLRRLFASSRGLMRWSAAE